MIKGMNNFMNENKAKIVLRNRKWGRIALTFESIYAALLLYTVMFNFGLFAHLIVIQFFIILTYFVSGWIYGFYLKHKSEDVSSYKNRETIADKFAIAFPHRASKDTFYHLLAIIDLLVSIGVMTQIVWIMYYDLTLKNNPFDILDSIGLYVNLVYLLAMLAIAVGFLMNYRKMIRNASILVMLLSIFLAIYWPHFLTTYIVGFIVSAVGLILYLKKKII